MKRAFFYRVWSLARICTAATAAFGQPEEYLRTMNWLRANNIEVNRPVTPSGYLRFWDCDSNVVYKKKAGDTIIFYTRSFESPASVDFLEQIKSRPYFNVTVYPRKVDKSGLLTVTHLAPLVFLLRSDSLWMADGTEKGLFQTEEMMDSMERYMAASMDSLRADLFGFAMNNAQRWIDAGEMEGLKAVERLWSGSHPSGFKVIFHKKLFVSAGSVLLKRKPISYRGREIIPEDKITLARQWAQGEEQYYLIAAETDRRFTNPNKLNLLFTLNGNFPDFENCQLNKEALLASVKSRVDSIAQQNADSVFNSRKKQTTAGGAALKRTVPEAFAQIAVYGKYGLIDDQGREIVPPKYNSPFFFREGLAPVLFHTKWGFVDERGREAILPAYEGAGEFNEGMAPVKRGKLWGYINREGQETVANHYEEAFAFVKGLAVVKLNGFYGLINKEGKVVAPLKYDRVFNDSFGDGRIVVQLNGKYSFVDRSGREMLPFKYDGLDHFFNGLAMVQVKGKTGFVNQNGREVIPAQFDEIRLGYNGLVIVAQKGATGLRYGLLDTSGREVVPLKYDDIQDFGEGLFLVRTGGQAGVIDKKGNEVVSLKYDDLRYFDKGLFVVRSAARSGVIDGKGNEVIPFRYASIHPVDSGYAKVEQAVRGQGTKEGLIDSHGKEIIPAVYDHLESQFTDGLMWATRKDRFPLLDQKSKVGAINEDGRVVIPFVYEDAWPFFQGLAGVRQNGRWGYVDKAGKTVVPCNYDGVGQLSEGMIAVTLNGKWGFVNKKGRQVTPLEFEQTTDFSKGLAGVRKGGKWGVINKQGKFVVPFLFDYVSSFQTLPEP